eukprot:TRINITY_DN206_c0_g1_i1.p3 TRINITY_DN206_c0_g1~~TRINITY_DN206_c0_g1_i1.p3  ORF type:complete len:139 (+),score=31.72 TRINITY_DN206_c0_g1_i1:1192-1608(+)
MDVWLLYVFVGFAVPPLVSFCGGCPLLISLPQFLEDKFVTPGEAFTGAAVALLFGALCWQLFGALQALAPQGESAASPSASNAAAVASSLRGTLLALFSSSAFLSAIAGVGLLGLGASRLSNPNPKGGNDTKEGRTGE